MEKKIVSTVGRTSSHDANDSVAPAWFAPAMKQALENYPTKDDLKREIAASLENYPTKDDLKRELKKEIKDALVDYPKKSDLLREIREAIKPLATKRLLVIFRKSMKDDFANLQKSTLAIRVKCLQEETFELRMENYPTTDYLQKLMDSYARRIDRRDKLDDIFDDVLKNQSNAIVDHTKRIATIEEHLNLASQ